MKYVFPAFPNMRGELAEYCRLYAFPRQPDCPPPDTGYIILDSGAYGLSQSGKKMDAAYIDRLAAHYREHARKPVFLFAPDVFLNPTQTMRQFSEWHSRHGIPVVPVVQFNSKNGSVDLHRMRKQLEFYRAYGGLLPHWEGKPFVCISNPSKRAIEGKNVVRVATLARQVMGEVWLHNLGAGWDREDILAWKNTAAFDSMDSIAYYTSAQDGWRWTTGSPVRDERPLRDVATDNARLINDLVCAAPVHRTD